MRSGIGAVLLVAKLDRLSRSVKFIATVLDAGVEFRACDMPDASRMVLHIMAAVAEGEAAAISARTRAALGAAKQRGVLLGGTARKARGLRPNLTRRVAAEGRARGQEANRTKAVSEYADVLPIIRSLRKQETSLRGIADALNRDGFTTRKGATWSAVQVQRVLRRAA
jgi:DNA invertase Pin-like site-specific DNA recombinase